MSFETDAEDCIHTNRMTTQTIRLLRQADAILLRAEYYKRNRLDPRLATGETPPNQKRRKRKQTAKPQRKGQAKRNTKPKEIIDRETREHYKAINKRLSETYRKKNYTADGIAIG